MRHRNRKTTPKVKKGKVQKKNNYQNTKNYWNTPQKEVIIDQEKAGKGYKHFLRKKDILQFIQLIPNWGEVSQDLDAIILARGEENCFGWYDGSGVIGICAWEKDLDMELSKEFLEEHQALLERLGVEISAIGNDYFQVQFTERQIKAFQLLHIFLHELGHHHDRIHTKSKRATARGEDYAEHYAFHWEKAIWKQYEEVFGLIT